MKFSLKCVFTHWVKELTVIISYNFNQPSHFQDQELSRARQFIKQICFPSIIAILKLLTNNPLKMQSNSIISTCAFYSFMI